MKSLIVYYSFLAAALLVEALPGDDAASATTGEDASFWNRFLAKDKSMSTLPPIEPCPTPPKPSPPTRPGGPENGPCDVDVTLKCVTESGEPCDDIKPPNPVCSQNRKIDAVSFGYSASACTANAGNRQGSEAFCMDNAPIRPTEAVTVQCKNAESGADLVVTPPKVSRAAIFTVTNRDGSSLPAKIDCIFTDADDVRLQQVVVDVSGDVELRLTDEFGAFTLLACDDTTCLEILDYDIVVENVGEIDMDITVVDFTYGGATTSLLGELDRTKLAPGKSTSVTERVPLDVCVGSDVSATVNVEANPPKGGAMCQDKDDLTFTVAPLEPIIPCPIPAPVKGPVQTTPALPPATRPVAAPMLPVATPVIPAPRPVVAPMTLPSSQLPPPTLPMAPPVKTPMVPPPMMGAPSAAGQCLLELEAACVILSGETTAVGQSCDTQVIGTGSVDLAFTVTILLPVTNRADTVTLTGLDATTNFAGSIDLVAEVAGQTLEPGGSLVVTLTGTIDASVRRMYTIMFVVEGTENPSGALCTGSDTLNTNSGSAPRSSPGVAPTTKGDKGDKDSKGESPTSESPGSSPSKGESPGSSPSKGESPVSAPSKGESPGSSSSKGESPGSSSSKGESPGSSPEGESPGSSPKSGGSPESSPKSGGSPESSPKSGGSSKDESPASSPKNESPGSIGETPSSPESASKGSSGSEESPAKSPKSSPMNESPASSKSSSASVGETPSSPESSSKGSPDSKESPAKSPKSSRDDSSSSTSGSSSKGSGGSSSMGSSGSSGKGSGSSDKETNRL
jgi:hypothetical protein